MTTRRLPLFKRAASPDPTTATTLAPDPGCERCAIGKARPPGSRCIPAEAAGPDTGDALFVLLDLPGGPEEKTRRPLAGQTGTFVRKLLPSIWKGPVVIDHAIRCVPSKDADLLEGVEACRPYSASALRECAPVRIVAMGQHAFASLTGQAVTALNARRGYGWATVAGKRVPVFLMLNPARAMLNRFLRTQFSDDVRWALTVPTSQLDPAPRNGRAIVASEPDDALRAIELLSRSRRWVSFDAEWGGRPFDADFKLLSLAFSFAPHDPLLDDEPDLSPEDAWVLTPSAWADPRVASALRAFFGNPNIGKAGLNLKSDALAINAGLGAELRGVRIDARFLRRMLESDAAADLVTQSVLVGRGGHKDEMKAARIAATSRIRVLARRGLSPDDIHAVLCGEAGAPLRGTPAHIDRILKGAEPDSYNYGLVPPDLLDRYNALDTVTTAMVCRLLEERLAADDPNLTRVWQRQVLPATEALAQVEAWGIPISVDALRAFGAFLDSELVVVRQRLAPHVPDDFNPSSTKQVSWLLYTKLKLPVTERTDSGAPSTSGDVLEELAKKSMVVRDLLRWRKLIKLKGTYADGKAGDGGLIAHVRDDGCIHPTINPDGARTGRTSSSDPNMQNTPRADTPEGKLLRDCFVAPPGWSFVELDHSQLELRIAADQSGDKEMLAIFNSGVDYHLRTAQLLAPVVWPGTDPATITKKSAERTTAKTLNFAVLYDDDPHGLAFRLGCSVQQATRIRDALFGRFRGLARYIEGRVAESARSGETWTWWDGAKARRRYLLDLGDVDDDARKTARRGSWNTPIQGTGSDYLLAGLTRAVNWIRDEGIPARVCVPIHDSIFAVVRDDALAEYLYVVPRLMTSFPTRNGVPLVVDGKVGKTWGAMEETKLP